MSIDILNSRPETVEGRLIEVARILKSKMAYMDYYKSPDEFKE